MKSFLLALLMWFAISGVAIAAVNINTATKEELTTLKGIGDKRAQDIIDYRTKNGPFKTIDDLEKVPGIGPGTMKQIRSQLSTTGKTTVDKPADTKSKADSAKPVKTAETKKAEPAKADPTKTDKAKETTSAQTKPEDKTKAPVKVDEKKTEKK
jgi:competence protein ComEA